MKKLTAWWQFTKERFHPVSHIAMILVFMITHVLLLRNNYHFYMSIPELVFLFVAITAFYFKLRLYDEIKDYELDCEINPHRPLPRGLLKRRDMYNGMIFCIMVEIILFSLRGINSLMSIFIAILYSLIMYKEFFIREKIRPHLTTYALVHTIVTTLLSLAIFSYLSRLSFAQVINEKPLFYFALANWFLFNLFEFGRKSFAPEEERPGVDSYSLLFGKTGAVALVMIQALAAHYLVFKLSGLNRTILHFSHGALFTFFAIVSMNYMFNERLYAARLFRQLSSLYIILFYLSLIAALSI